MSKQSDIVDKSLASTRKYGLIYTRKCGWVDLGHANPAGALKLWTDIWTEKDYALINLTKNYFLTNYSQRMRKGWFQRSSSQLYILKRSLTRDQKKRVALSIFLDVSHEFESLQGSWPYCWATDSGYSAEDLVSNLIGFYRAVEPGLDYIKMCEPVSKESALKIWDDYGSVGSNKNRTLSPFLYPIEGDPTASQGPMCGQLPHFLNTIKTVPTGCYHEKRNSFVDFPKESECTKPDF